MRYKFPKGNKINLERKQSDTTKQKRSETLKALWRSGKIKGNTGRTWKKGKYIDCIICGKPFYVKPCFVKYKKRFCSLHCKYIGFKGKFPWNKGKKMGRKFREKMSKALKMRWRKGFGKPPRLGTKQSNETKKKISLSHGGNGIPQKRGKSYHLHDWQYRKWRKAVFERDNYTCMWCGKTNYYLEPHHIKGWAKHPELRYEVKNGVILCYECHKLTRKILL